MAGNLGSWKSRTYPCRALFRPEISGLRGWMSASWRPVYVSMGYSSQFEYAQCLAASTRSSRGIDVSRPTGLWGDLLSVQSWCPSQTAQQRYRASSRIFNAKTYLPLNLLKEYAS